MNSKDKELKPDRSPLRWGLVVLWWAINIPLLGIPAIIRAGPRRMWDDFFSFAFGTYKRDSQTKRILWIRFVNYPDSIHFHYLIWGSFTLAFLQWIAPSIGMQNVFTPFGIATAFFVIGFLCLLIYFRDTPIWSLFGLCGFIILIIGADIGLRLGMSRLDNFFDSKAASGGWAYQALDWTVGLVPEALKRGILAPLWDGYKALRPEASPGLWMLFGIGVAIILAKPVFLAVMRNRNELDVKNLKQRSFGERDADEPIFMRRSAVVITDIFEAMSSFCDFHLKVQGGTEKFKNIFGGAFWLRGPFKELREYATPEELRDQAEQREQDEREDAAELVAGTAQSHGDGHGTSEFVPDGDGDPAHESHR